MYETIILAVCLVQTLSICKEVNISVEPDLAGSLQLPPPWRLTREHDGGRHAVAHALAAWRCARHHRNLAAMAANRCIARRDFTWVDAGIHARGRLINRKFDLDRNYRNTAEILRAARAFAGPTESAMQGVLALPVEPDHPLRA